MNQLNRDHVIQRSSLSGCESFASIVGNFVFNAFINFEPSRRFENSSDMNVTCLHFKC